MKFPSRIVVLTITMLIFGLVMAIHPQEVSDIASMARDLKKTLKDVDERLRHLEQLVKNLSAASKKNGSRGPVQVSAAGDEAASQRFEAQQAYLKGRIEEDSQQDARAIELFTKACELDPTNDSAFLHRAFVNYRIGRVDEALYDVNRSLTIQPDNSRAFAFRAKVYRSSKDYSHAMADLNEAVRRDEKNPDYWADQAGIEEERGNFAKAADLYSAAISLDRPSVDLHLKRASALNQAGNQSAAMQECVQAIDLKPKEADGYVCRADSFVRSGKLVAAANDLNQAITLRPDSSPAIKLLPVVQQLLDMNQAVVRLSTPTAPPTPLPAPEAPPIPASPAATPPVVTRAEPPPQAPPAQPAPAETSPRPAARRPEAPQPEPRVASVQQSPVNPSRLTSPTSERPPVSGKASDLLQESRKYLDQGMFALAILKLNEAIAIDPSSSAALYNARGYAYLRTRAYQSAINDFSKAIEIRPIYANAYWNRATARRLQGDGQGASDDARKAVSLGWVVDPSASLKFKASR